MVHCVRQTFNQSQKIWSGVQTPYDLTFAAGSRSVDNFLWLRIVCWFS